jgi:peptide/nickel transport system permease protein
MTTAVASSPLAATRRKAVSFVRRSLRFAKREPIGTVAGILIILLLLSAILAPVISEFDPTKTRVGRPFTGPGWDHWFGTDQVGRDVFSRVVHGGRVSLLVGIVSVAIGTVAGTIIGLLSGYFGGVLDIVLQRIIDAIMSIPTMVLALALISIFEPGTDKLILTIAVVMTPSSARIVRGAVLAVKPNMYIEAAKAMGAGSRRILLRHVLPNIIAPILVIGSVQIGNAILLEASLSFLGLGPPPPNPSWGYMISQEGRDVLTTAPWIGIFPGIFLSLTVFGFNMLGDTVRDVLDPKLRGRIG